MATDGGAEVASAGDLTGDGEVDLLVALGLLGYHGSYDGAAWSTLFVVEGPVSGDLMVGEDAAASLTYEEDWACFREAARPRDSGWATRWSWAATSMATVSWTRS